MRRRRTMQLLQRSGYLTLSQRPSANANLQQKTRWIICYPAPAMKWVFVLFFFLSTTALAGQQPIERDRPVAQAMRIMADEKIAVDGRLDEAGWTRAVAITDFKQFEPRNGEQGTERTEIRIIF